MGQLLVFGGQGHVWFLSGELSVGLSCCSVGWLAMTCARLCWVESFAREGGHYSEIGLPVSAWRTGTFRAPVRSGGCWIRWLVMTGVRSWSPDNTTLEGSNKLLWNRDPWVFAGQGHVGFLPGCVAFQVGYKVMMGRKYFTGRWQQITQKYGYLWLGVSPFLQGNKLVKKCAEQLWFAKYRNLKQPAFRSFWIFECGFLISL